jgi:rod shape-determining protein MreD
MPDALAVQRITLRVFVVFAAYLAQVGLVDRMRLPLVGPNLLLLVVVSFALVGGRQRGAQLGFFAGLVADLLPPSDHLVGLFAFTYTLIGYAVGMIDTGEETSLAASFAAVAGGSMAMVLAYGGLGGLVGDDGVTAHATVHSLIGTVVYDVVLAPFVVPLVARTARRLEPVGPRSVGLH